jgi:predicted DNA-binding protein YlxM (UPF0122 family)
MPNLELQDIDIRALSTEHRYELIYTLYASGDYKIKDIAEHFQIDRKTVYNAIKKIGDEEFQFTSNSLKAMAMSRIDGRIQILQEQVLKAQEGNRHSDLAKLMTVLRREEEFKLNVGGARVQPVEGGTGGTPVQINLITNIPRQDGEAQTTEINVTPQETVPTVSIRDSLPKPEGEE